ncbi:DUF218 family protein [Octadecabacter antarcticus 307]|uniref:DUF218 family protein n=1 Tax=Octadecabacter antarcticus 307 TaxID=391626 RepID=M9RGD8_9RHOB|nr:YdcF family protein [Octadecabacter antarcticus]AGI69446.1 DUF218 family protein [Octadecabacter antarcticus 307]
MAIGIILGAAVWRDGRSPTLRRRTLHALTLYNGGHISFLVLCGGVGKHPPSETAAMQKILRGAGVRDDAMVLENLSTTTGENIRFAQTLINEIQRQGHCNFFHNNLQICGPTMTRLNPRVEPA